MLFGKRQASVGFAIIENYKRAEEILKTSQESAGSALRENEIYLNSIQGKLDKLSATWQSLSNSLLNSDTVKDLISGADTLLGIIKTIVDNLGLMPGLVAAIATAWSKANNVGTFFESGQKNSQAFIKNKQSLWGFKDIWTSFKGESGFVLDTEQLKIIEKYNEEIQKGLIPSGKQIRKIVGDNNDALVKYLRSLNGGIAETKQFYNAILLGATGLKGMGTALKTVGKTVATTAIQFAAFTAIAWAIGKAWDWVQKIWVENVNTLGNLKKRAETATEALESTKNEIEQINQELKTSNERIAELNGKGPLTLSEQSELKRLKTQNALLDQQLKILKEIKIEQNKEASEKNLDVVSRLNKDADAKIKEYKQAKEAYDEATDALSKSDNQNKAQRQDKYQKAKK